MANASNTTKTAAARKSTGARTTVARVVTGGERVKAVPKQAAAARVTGEGLVNRFPSITVQPAPGTPKHLTKRQMSAMLKLMKIAA